MRLNPTGLTRKSIAPIASGADPGLLLLRDTLDETLFWYRDGAARWQAAPKALGLRAARGSRPIPYATLSDRQHPVLTRTRTPLP